MKPILILVIALLCIFTQNSCTRKTQTVFGRENLNGKVKSVRTTNGRESIKTDFDKSGKVIRHETRYTTSTWIKSEYIYDREGHLLSYCSYHDDRPNEKLYYKFKYNRRGLLVSSEVGERHKTFYKHKRGNCVLEIQPDIKIKRVYNRQHQVIQDFPYTDWKEKIRSWGTDNEGNFFEKEEMTGPYRGSRTFYKYNKYGYVSQVRVKNIDYKYTIDVAYLYDTKGNWIERTTTSQGERKSVTCHSALDTEGINGARFTRVIEYYE